MTSWHSYPKIFNFGHAYLENLLTGHVLVEEKVDGSQFSFGRFGEEIRVRSKGIEMPVTAPEGMFEKAVAWVVANAQNLTDGWTYRAEYLQKPKHNTLAYERCPTNHLMVFDINTSEETYLPYGSKKAEVERIGLECVPWLWEGPGSDLTLESLKGLLSLKSALGGQLIEGVVVKNYSQFGRDKKVLMGKHVSEAFKEVHSKEWKKSNPTKTDIIVSLGDKYRCKARWNKAIQHLKEAGKLEVSPRDIGALMPEVIRDVHDECEEEIKKELFAFAWPSIKRSIVRGLPEWYKEKLLAKQFESNPVQEDA